MSGALAVKHANKESNQELVNVIYQLQSTVERNAMERHRKVKFVTRTYPAQVSLNYRPLHKVIHKHFFFFFLNIFNVFIKWACRVANIFFSSGVTCR